MKLKAHSLWHDNQCQNKHMEFVVVDIRFVDVAQSRTTKIRYTFFFFFVVGFKSMTKIFF